MQVVYKVMTIAGSDSGAGAGLQADLKTFAAFGVYGTSVITAITAQNTQRVTQIMELPPGLIAAQIDAVIQDIGTSALKTGMLANAEIIALVAEKIQEHHLPNLVVDPVMVAKGGDRLLRKDAIETLRSRLIPLATIVTPNLPKQKSSPEFKGPECKRSRTPQGASSTWAQETWLSREVTGKARLKIFSMTEKHFVS